jgi:hypothetical protein
VLCPDKILESEKTLERKLPLSGQRSKTPEVRRFQQAYWTVHISRVQVLEARVAPLREQLARHPLYGLIRTQGGVRTFMESHVFAVWDFMSLLKALQTRLTCVRTPWVPSPYPQSRRFINEIVLGEESDLYEGRTVSHFELYVEAMRDCGANVAPILQLQQELAGSDPVSVESALARINAPGAASAFVASTFRVIREGGLHAVAAAFTFGREDLIPDVFRALVRDLNVQLSGDLRKFIWYLERHIEVDSEDHGPLALSMVQDLCGFDDKLWEEAGEAAESALRSRLLLWDGIAEQLES